MKKVKFEFNQGEIEALLQLIVMCDYNVIEDHEKATLAQEVVRKLPRKLSIRYNNLPNRKKKTTFTMSYPEAVSLKIVMEAYIDNTIDRYSFALKQKVLLTVGSKLLT